MNFLIGLAIGLPLGIAIGALSFEYLHFCKVRHLLETYKETGVELGELVDDINRYVREEAK